MFNFSQFSPEHINTFFKDWEELSVMAKDDKDASMIRDRAIAFFGSIFTLHKANEFLSPLDNKHYEIVGIGGLTQLEEGALYTFDRIPHLPARDAINQSPQMIIPDFEWQDNDQIFIPDIVEPDAHSDVYNKHENDGQNIFLPDDSDVDDLFGSNEFNVEIKPQHETHNEVQSSGNYLSNFDIFSKVGGKGGQE